VAMQKIRFSEVKNLVEYERVRDAMRARIIELKRRRRVAVGDHLTFLFENRDTVLFQIQEMVRTERVVDDARVQDEIDVYNALVPDPGELSATLFIEIPDLIHMTQEQVRRAVNRFQGLDREGVWLVVGGRRIPARFEEGHSSEEKMAAVHYLRFALPPEVRLALAAGTVRIVVDHPGCRGEAVLTPDVRSELLKDLEA
jgi:hypothetical protein